jgi:hypothetical protein
MNELTVLKHILSTFTLAEDEDFSITILSDASADSKRVQPYEGGNYAICQKVGHALSLAPLTNLDD